MSGTPEVMKALEGTGWQVAVDRNPHTGQWHWIIWEGPASFKDKAFVRSYNDGLKQHEPSREQAIEAAVMAALDRHAGMVSPPLFDTTEQPFEPDA